MAYAIDIIGDTFEKTKKLFFPVRVGYWLRMGFINLFSSSMGGGGGGSSGGSSNYSPWKGSNLNFSQAVSSFNTQALAFLAQYGFFVALGFLILWAISLFFSYIDSMFTFMFLEGVVEKDIRIKKSFANNQVQGTSLFLLRFIVGIIFSIFSLILFLPLISAFFQNQLANFNFLLLIPMFLVIILIAIPLGIFWFLVYDFLVPIMYFDKIKVKQAWKKFKKIASKQKMEIFLYWLLKLVLGIGAGIVSFIVLFGLFFVALFFVLFGLLIYLGINMLSQTAAIAVAIFLGGILLLLFIYATSVLMSPVQAFFRQYSVEMLKKLES